MSDALSCPKCSAPLEAHEVVDGVSVHHCPSCFGVLYEERDLAVPLDLSGLTASKWKCPRCAVALETGTGYDKAIEVDRCPTCAALWFDAGEIQILRKLTGVENLAGPRKDDDEPPAKTPAAKAGPAAAPAKPDAAARFKTPAKSTDKGGDGIVSPKEMTSVDNPDARTAPVAEWGGREYDHFQTSLPVTVSVLGEFPWVAKVGDSAKMRDFIRPPFVLSEEITDAETVWTEGEYVEPEEVWAAFAMDGNPPPKRGVAAAQPNPWSGSMWTLWGSFGLAAGAVIGTYMLLSASSPRAIVYDGGFGIASTDAEKSRVSDVFELKGRTSNLELSLDTNLDGHWSYLSLALIDADTDKAIDFGREISYYHGYEDGESWSEGSGRESVIVPSVPSGRYYLRLEPETDAPQLSVHVVARRDVPLLRLPVIAIVLLLIPVVWGVIRQDNFESERWMESDHPRVSSSEDDD